MGQERINGSTILALRLKRANYCQENRISKVEFWPSWPLRYENGQQKGIMNAHTAQLDSLRPKPSQSCQQLLYGELNRARNLLSFLPHLIVLSPQLQKLHSPLPRVFEALRIQRLEH